MSASHAGLVPSTCEMGKQPKQALEVSPTTLQRVVPMISTCEMGKQPEQAVVVHSPLYTAEGQEVTREMFQAMQGMISTCDMDKQLEQALEVSKTMQQQGLVPST